MKKDSMERHENKQIMNFFSFMQTNVQYIANIHQVDVHVLIKCVCVCMLLKVQCTGGRATT